MDTDRFSDKKYRLSDFEHEVWVACPACGRQAIAVLKETEQQARLFCVHCGLNKKASVLVAWQGGKTAERRQAAHLYFNASLWYSHAFKGDVFWAYNPQHLSYLEQYISAKIREHKDRDFFTLLEKLPKFYHEAKNREGLLKVIAKLRMK